MADTEVTKTAKVEAKDKKIKRSNKVGKNLDFASAEAYNMLRASIEFTCVKEDGSGKIIGITSPCPQEGKSLTSINLSYAIAKKGHSVILLEGDLRRPSISKTLGIDKTPGLSNYLVDDNSSLMTWNVLHENMKVIASGDIPPNPSELIASNSMEKLLKWLSKKYDYVIVDLPPVNSVSDAYAMSSFVDGILLVVRHTITRRSDLMEAYRQLSFAGAHLLGVVYNGYTHNGGYYYRKGYSGYKYYRRGGYYKDYGYGYGYYDYRPDYRSYDYRSDYRSYDNHSDR